MVAAYGYDANGLTAQVGIRRSAGGASLYDIALGRNAFGAVTTATDSDGVGLDHSAAFTYDLAGRLTGATLGKAPAAGQPDKRFEFAYAYDGFQNMVSRTMTRGPRALGQYLGTHCYGQNGAGPRQLTSVVVEGGFVTMSGSVGGGGGGSGAAVDLCASPTRAVVAALTYDDAGRQITDGATHMTYDGLDQLVGVDLPGGGHIAYAYGYDGQRIQSSDSMGGPVEHWMGEGLREVGGNYEQYVSMGGRIVAKVTLRYSQAAGAGATQASLMAGRGIGVVVGVVLAMVMLFAGWRWRRSWRHGLAGRTLASLLVWMMVVPACGPSTGSGQSDLWRPQRTTYFHTGFGPGPVLLTSESATVVDERRAEPFGQAIDSYQEGLGTQDAIDYALEPTNSLNKPTDPRTQWSYHGARWMAPQTGRWLTPDPPVKGPDAKFMGAPWKLHPYQYVCQNPLTYWDPDGWEKKKIIVLWGAAQPKSLDPKKFKDAAIAQFAAEFGGDVNMKVHTIENAADIKLFLAGKSADVVIYFGHAAGNTPQLVPGVRKTGVSPMDLNDALATMKRRPARIQLQGCETEDNGFAQILSSLDPTATVVGFRGYVDAVLEERTDGDGRKVQRVRYPGAKTVEYRYTFGEQTRNGKAAKPFTKNVSVDLNGPLQPEDE